MAISVMESPRECGSYTRCISKPSRALSQDEPVQLRRAAAQAGVMFKTLVRGLRRNVADDQNQYQMRDLARQDYIARRADPGRFHRGGAEKPGREHGDQSR